MTRTYCDESRQRQHKYMLIGSLWIGEAARDDYARRCAEFRGRPGYADACLKWTKVSNRKLQAYKELMDLFFAADVRFKCILVESSKVDYARFHHGDKELGFYKFYYLLVSRTVAFNEDYVIVTHRLSTRERTRLRDLQSAINNWCNLKAGRTVFPIRSIDAATAHGCDALQLVDVLMGAIGYQWNACDTKPDASAAKKELCAYIAAKLGRRSLQYASGPGERKVNVWKWEPAEAKKAPPARAAKSGG